MQIQNMKQDGFAAKQSQYGAQTIKSVQQYKGGNSGYAHLQETFGPQAVAQSKSTQQPAIPSYQNYSKQLQMQYQEQQQLSSQKTQDVQKPYKQNDSTSGLPMKASAFGNQIYDRQNQPPRLQSQQPTQQPTQQPSTQPITPQQQNSANTIKGGIGNNQGTSFGNMNANQSLNNQQSQVKLPFLQFFQDQRILQNRTNNQQIFQSPGNTATNATLQNISFQQYQRNYQNNGKSSNIFYLSNGSIQQAQNSLKQQQPQPSNQNQNPLNYRQATPLKANDSQGQLKQLNQYGQKNIQSPAVPTGINQQAVYSPMPKVQQLVDNSILCKGSIGPGQQPLFQTRSPQVQKVAGGSQSNAQTLIEELTREKEKNKTLAEKLKRLEFSHKGQNTSFLNDLEKRIKQLIQKNDQLQTLNQELNMKLTQNPNEQDRTELIGQVAKIRAQNEEISQMITDQTRIVNEYKSKCEELENRLIEQENNQNEEEQIRMLVADLEEKVQGLIIENDRLNQILSKNQDLSKADQKTSIQNEKQKIQKLIATTTKEIESLKYKYDDLMKKNNQDFGRVDIKIYNDQVEELEGKIKLLIEENDNLNNIVQQQIQNERRIADLEEEMQALVEQNDQLEEELNKWKTVYEKGK